MADALGQEILITSGMGGTPSWTTADLKNATPNAVAVGWVVSIRSADTITHVGFRQGVTTGTPGATSYTIGCYTVDGSGLPTATDLGGGSPTAKNFQPSSANDGTWVWVQLTNSVAVTRGQLFSIVLQNNADTSANGITATHDQSGGAAPSSLSAGSPYSLTYAASTWTKSSSSFRSPSFAFKSASNVYGIALQGGTHRTETTSGRRLACKFTVPSGWCTSYKISGVRIWGRGGAAASTFTVGLWSASALLQSITGYDSDVFRAAGTSSGNLFLFQDTTLATLSAGTAYYVGLESISSSTVGLTTMDFASSGDLLCLPNGVSASYATYNGSAWSDVLTSVPIMTLILDDITPPSGGGGIIRPVPMSGGFV